MANSNEVFGYVADLADTIAELVFQKLGQSVIPSAFPAEIGQCIREANKHGGSVWRHTIPMTGPSAIFVEYRFNPDGTLNMEFHDTNGSPFWRGTFRPVEEK